MKGRLYDPFTARFLSSDILIQDPTATDNFNLYSYALNNPLKYVDPSGYNYKPWDWDAKQSGWIGINYGPVRNTPGSNNHWSDNYRSYEGDAFLMSRTTFENKYGPGSYNVASTMLSVGFSNFTNIQTQYETGRDYYDVDEPGYAGGVYIHYLKMNILYNQSYYQNTTNAEGQGGSNPFTLLDAVGGLLTLEDGYNNFFHNHTTYTTTKGIKKNIYKANGAVRSARAAKFATTSKIVKRAGVAGTLLMTGVAFSNIVNSLNNGTAVSGKDVADFSVGAVGLSTTALVTLGIVSNPVGWVIGGGVALYSLGSLAYDLYTTDW